MIGGPDMPNEDELNEAMLEAARTDQPLSEEREREIRALVDAPGSDYWAIDRKELLAEIDRLRAEVASWKQEAREWADASIENREEIVRLEALKLTPRGRDE